MTRETTIEKYRVWLERVKNLDGKVANFKAMAADLHIDNSIHYHAKEMGLITIRGSKVYCNYASAEPVYARRLAEKINARIAETKANPVTARGSYKAKGEVVTFLTKGEPKQEPKAETMIVTSYVLDGYVRTYATKEMTDWHDKIHEKAEQATTYEMNLGEEWMDGFGKKIIRNTPRK